MKIKAKKVKKIFTKIPWLVAEHSFLACLLLFLLALLLGWFLVYKYIILIQETEFEEQDHSFLLKEDVYKEVLEKWKREEQKFNQADSKEFFNPFLKPLPEQE